MSSATEKELSRVMAHLDISFNYNATFEAVEAIRQRVPVGDRRALHRLYSDIEDTRDKEQWIAYGDAVQRLMDYKIN